jgi:hypothetical protein
MNYSSKFLAFTVVFAGIMGIIIGMLIATPHYITTIQPKNITCEPVLPECKIIDSEGRGFLLHYYNQMTVDNTYRVGYIINWWGERTIIDQNPTEKPVEDSRFNCVVIDGVCR